MSEKKHTCVFKKNLFTKIKKCIICGKQKKTSQFDYIDERIFPKQ